MIKRVRVKNFKGIKDTSIDFNDRLFVLAGQNESGKSSILEAIYTFEESTINRETLNFEEESIGNLIQLIEITYTNLDDDFYTELNEKCYDIQYNNQKNSLVNKYTFINDEKIRKIKEYTLTRIINHETNKVNLELNESTIGIFRSALLKEISLEDTSLNPKVITNNVLLDVNKYKEEIAEMFWKISPNIVLFDEIIDVLPDSIFISELEVKNSDKIKGFKAVKNFESIIGIDFIKLSSQSETLKKGTIETKNKSITATFQKDWKQEISKNKKIEINFEISYDNTGREKLKFYIKSKDGVFLEPRRRSKGLIWFLSLWLELKASEKLNNIVFLFDEPGANLHVKANNDMLKVFRNLVEKGHQIIYATHTPSLIEIDKLHNIGLVVNTEDNGTVVESLTSSNIDSQHKRDALQPISEAMGLEPFNDFTIISKKNIILEGLSDFWYFKAMSIILNKKNEYKFVPGIGVKSSKIFPLISFCIGYGLDWILIIENGLNPSATKKELKEKLFSDNEVELNNKIKTINFKEVEDMFSLSDFKLVDPKINEKSTKNPSEILSNRKIIIAKKFFLESLNGNITKEKLNASTILNFEEIFDFIDEKLYK